MTLLNVLFNLIVEPLKLFFESTSLPASLGTGWRSFSYYIYTQHSSWSSAGLYSEVSKAKDSTNNIFFWHYIDGVPTIWQ